MHDLSAQEFAMNVARALRRRESPEDAALRETLLNDVENQQATVKKRRPWYRLVGVAARYMWPDSLMLKVSEQTGCSGFASLTSKRQASMLLTKQPTVLDKA